LRVDRCKAWLDVPSITFIKKMVLTGIPGKVIDTITKKLGLQTAVERSVFELAPTIQPIINADENFINVVATADNSGTSSTVYTTSTVKDFYLTNAQISGRQAAASANSYFRIAVTLESGETVVISQINVTSGNDLQEVAERQFDKPIKLKKGSNILVQVSNAVDSLATATIMGYNVDV